MASWSENSSYQGAASGAAAGGMTGNPVGVAAGAAIGFVAGGLIGGSSEDAARKAEEERQKEIQRAIERQNTADFNAKAQAEQWAIADIGISKEDQVKDARANTAGLQKNVDTNTATVNELLGKRSYNGKNGITEENWATKKSQYSSANWKYVANVDNAVFSSGVAKSALEANEGIIANYEKNMGVPKKY